MRDVIAIASCGCVVGFSLGRLGPALTTEFMALASRFGMTPHFVEEKIAKFSFRPCPHPPKSR